MTRIKNCWGQVHATTYACTLLLCTVPHVPHWALDMYWGGERAGSCLNSHVCRTRGCVAQIHVLCGLSCSCCMPLCVFFCELHGRHCLHNQAKQLPAAVVAVCTQHHMWHAGWLHSALLGCEGAALSSGTLNQPTAAPLARLWVLGFSLL